MAKSPGTDRKAELIGKVELHPLKTQHIHSLYRGVAKDVFKSVGDTVRKGDPLARIENNVGVQSYTLAAILDGTVIDRQVSAGQTVDTDTALFVVSDTTALQVAFQLRVEQLATLKAGVIITVYSLDKTRSLPCITHFVSPVLDPQSRTAAALCYIDNTNSTFVAGELVYGITAKAKNHAADERPKADL